MIFKLLCCFFGLGLAAFLPLVGRFALLSLLLLHSAAFKQHCHTQNKLFSDFRIVHNKMHDTHTQTDSCCLALLKKNVLLNHIFDGKTP